MNSEPITSVPARRLSGNSLARSVKHAVSVGCAGLAMFVIYGATSIATVTGISTLALTATTTSAEAHRRRYGHRHCRIVRRRGRRRGFRRICKWSKGVRSRRGSRSRRRGSRRR